MEFLVESNYPIKTIHGISGTTVDFSTDQVASFNDLSSAISFAINHRVKMNEKQYLYIRHQGKCVYSLNKQKEWRY
jgi:hypothetical protein